MNQDPTVIWVGLCLFLALVSYCAGYTRRAITEEERRDARRRTTRYIQKL